MLSSSIRTPLSQASSYSAIVKVALGIVLLYAASKLYIPLRPIPISLQSMAVLLIGFTYTPRSAFAALAGWLALGAVGLPVFAAPVGGLAELLGPAAGYRYGFLIAAPVMALVQQKYQLKSTGFLTLCGLLGNTIIFLCGIAWLTRFCSFATALQTGLLPFILPGCGKTLLLVGCLKLIGQKKTFHH